MVLAGRSERDWPLDLAAPPPHHALVERLRGFDLVVNATPLGMHDDDPLPLDPTRLAPATFVGEVVLKATLTPLLQAALARGCRIQVGADMLFEQIPAYLEFFALPTTTPEALRAVAQLDS